MSWSISESPLEFEITRVDCILEFIATYEYNWYLSLIWLISYELLIGKKDDMCRKITKEECLTFVRLTAVGPDYASDSAFLIRSRICYTD